MFVGKKDIARRIVEAGNHGVGFVVFQHGDGLVKGVGREEVNIRVVGGGLPGGVTMSEFRKDDFHETIITYFGEGEMTGNMGFPCGQAVLAVLTSEC